MYLLDVYANGTLKRKSNDNYFLFSKNNIQKFKALDIMGFFLIKTMRRKPCIDRQRDRQKDERTDRHTRVSQYTLFTFGAEVKKNVYFFSLQL